MFEVISAECTDICSFKKSLREDQRQDASERSFSYKSNGKKQENYRHMID